MTFQPRVIIRQPPPIIRELPPLIDSGPIPTPYQPSYAGFETQPVCPPCPPCDYGASLGAYGGGYGGGGYGGALIRGPYGGEAAIGGYRSGYGGGVAAYPEVPAWFDGRRGGRIVDKHKIRFRRGWGPFAGL